MLSVNPALSKHLSVFITHQSTTEKGSSVNIADPVPDIHTREKPSVPEAVGTHTGEKPQTKEILSGEMPIRDTQHLKSMYPKCFIGLGKYPNKVKLHLRPDAKPVISNRRKCPIHLRNEIQSNLYGEGRSHNENS